MKTRIMGAIAGTVLLAAASGVSANEMVSATVFLSVYLEPAQLAAAPDAAVSTSCVDAIQHGMQNGEHTCNDGTTTYTLEEDPDAGTLLITPI